MSIEALRAARQALQEVRPFTMTGSFDILDRGVAAIDAALAKPAASGEPVAWFCQWFDADGSPHWDQYHDANDPMPDTWDEPPTRITPLYATAQPAPALVPLTFEHIDRIGVETVDALPEQDNDAVTVWMFSAAGLTAFVRGIEAAHGITPTKTEPL